MVDSVKERIASKYYVRKKDYENSNSYEFPKKDMIRAGVLETKEYTTPLISLYGDLITEFLRPLRNSVFRDSDIDFGSHKEWFMDSGGSVYGFDEIVEGEMNSNDIIEAKYTILMIINGKPMKLDVIANKGKAEEAKDYFGEKLWGREIKDINFNQDVWFLSKVYLREIGEKPDWKTYKGKKI